MRISLTKLAVAGGALALEIAAPARAQDVLRVGEGPFITGGGFLVANEKGYFKKLGLQIETKMFIDGAQAVPALIAGDLDLTFMTANAGLFNSVARGAPLVVIVDRGDNKIDPS